MVPPSEQSAPGLGFSVRHPTRLGMAFQHPSTKVQRLMFGKMTNLEGPVASRFGCFIGHLMAFLVGSAFGSGTLPDFQPMSH